MNAIQRKRLLKLADFLEQLPPQKFDFGVIVTEGAKPMLEALKAREESCGTVACAIGWMPAVFPRLTKWKRSRSGLGLVVGLKDTSKYRNFEVAERFFGISKDDARYLFNPGDSVLSYDASAKQVAKHIRSFVGDAK